MKNTPVLLVAVASLLLAAPAAQAQQGKTVPAVQNDKQGKNIQSKGVNPDPKKAKRKFIDPANMDLSVNPGDNFYLYANGNWIKNTPVPASKTRWGSFDILAEESSQALKGLLEDAAKNPGSNSLMKRVGDLYASAMDSATIEQLGYQPIKPILDEITKVNTREEVISQINSLRARAISSGLYRIGVGQDSRNVTRYIVNIGQGGTTLPDRDYYLKNDARNQGIRKEYVNYIVKLFTLCGTDEATAAKNAETILKLETSIAGAQMSRVEMRDPVKLYNKMAVSSLAAKNPNLDWYNTLKQLGYTGNVDSVVVSAPKFLTYIDSLVSAVPVDDWKTYLQWNVMRDAAPYLSSAFADANFAYNKALTGQKEQTPRWQRMSGLVDNQLGELLGQLYVDKYFKPAAKERMKALIENMMQTFEERIQRLDWMSTETKMQALNKLHAFTRKIGYPDKWKNYDGLQIQRGDFLGNLRRCNEWRYKDNISRLGKPVDKTEWGMTPPTVNAYYSPQKNEIVFPAGILRYPFFDFEADDAINYGGIAAVIGHEMTHGFDDQGRQFDADGNLHDWWTKADADEFKKRADMVVDQYNGYTVLDTMHVNGKLTLGENLADLGGLSIAYEAFKKTEQGKHGKPIDGFTPDQRFFLNWAQVWRQNILPEAQAQRIVTDPHSPGVYRANGPLTNIDAFYDAFHLKEGDKMYKPKDKRIRIW
ncbi:MAG: M13 family metallopeptidase [Ferruginibacter sp.]